MQRSIELLIKLPPPANLLTFRKHEKAEEIAKASDCWARKIFTPLFPSAEALERYLDSKAALWPCLCYPSADPERLLQMQNLNQFSFAFDDFTTHYDGSCKGHSAEEVIASIKEILHGRVVVNPSPWAHVFAEIWDNMAREMAPGVRARFVRDYEDILTGFRNEALLKGAKDLQQMSYSMCDASQ